MTKQTSTTQNQLVPMPGLPKSVSAADALVEMALATCTSDNTRRVYRLRLRYYLASQLPFNREGIAAHLAQLRQEGKSECVTMLAMAAIKKLAKEAEIRHLISYDEYRQITDLSGGKVQRQKTGMWLTVSEVEDLLTLPDRSTYYGKRDAAILCALVGTGLRRDELLHLNWDQYQSREGRMCLVNVRGKGGKLRTVPVPLWAQSDIDVWQVTIQTQEPPPAPGALEAANLIRRERHPLNSKRFCGRLGSTRLAEIVIGYGQRIGIDLRPHDLRRTLAKMMHRAGAGIEQIQFTLGHQHMQTTTIYLGSLLEIAPGQAGVDKVQIAINRKLRTKVVEMDRLDSHLAAAGGKA
jgi:integrase/recombinase XerD